MQNWLDSRNSLGYNRLINSGKVIEEDLKTMFRRYKCFLIAILAAVVIVQFIGCSQPDDVVAPVSATKLVLKPERLPTLPADYVYHLWVIDSMLVNPQAYSIGSFIWNNELFGFYDLDSNRVDSIWNVNYDVLDPFYRYLAVSIERRDDLPTQATSSLDSVGPIMLQDTLVNPVESPVKLVFPLDLWLATGFFCVETPSDSNSNSHDASGIWFTEYIYDSIRYADTFNVQFRFVAGRDTISRDLILDTVVGDTSYWDCNQYQFGRCIDSTEVLDTLLGYDFTYIDVIDADTFWVFYPEGPEGVADTLEIALLAETLDTLQITRRRLIIDSSYQLTDTLILDSFVHKYYQFDFVRFPVNISGAAHDTTITLYRPDTLYRVNGEFIDPTPDVDTAYDSTFRIFPLVDYNHTLIYTGFITSTFLRVDKFLESYEDGTDLNSIKWHYKGWVLSPYLQPLNSFGSVQKPAWHSFYMNQELSPITGGLITTGGFKSFRDADDSNPYTDNHRVPSVPGEDFLLNLPAGVDSIYFCDASNPSVSAGTVFITLEPDNYNDDERNFPLVYMVGKIPSYANVSITSRHNQFAVGDPTFQMFNKFSAVDGNTVGFPAIHVTIIRE